MDDKYREKEDCTVDCIDCTYQCSLCAAAAYMTCFNSEIADFELICCYGIIAIKDKHTPVVLEIRIPIVTESLCESVHCNKYSDSFHDGCSCHRFSTLDPNLGILGQLPNRNILYKINTLNEWNFEPYYLKLLPSKTDTEQSILLFGGLNPNSVANNEYDFSRDIALSSSIFQFKVNTGVLHYFGTMIEPRCYHCCTFIDQHVYVTGGYSLLKCEQGEMQAVSSTDKLDLVNIRWQRCASMNTARAAHAAISYKKSVYVFGGRDVHGNLLSCVEKYDPEQDLWMNITLLPQPTAGLCTVYCKDKIWILGGVTNTTSHPPSNILSSHVFSFDPLLNRWSRELSLPYPCAYSACVTDNQSMWLIGGCTICESLKQNDLRSCSSVLKMSLQVQPYKWVSIVSLWHPRHALTAILYEDTISVLGGIESSKYCASDKVEYLKISTNLITEGIDLPFCIAGSGSIFLSKQDGNVINSSKYSSTSVSSEYKTAKSSDTYRSNVICPHSNIHLKKSHSLDCISRISNYACEKQPTSILGYNKLECFDNIEHITPDKANERLFTSHYGKNKNRSQNTCIHNTMGNFITPRHSSSIENIKETHKNMESFQNSDDINDRKLRNRVSMEIYLNPAEKKPSILQRKWMKYYDIPLPDSHLMSDISKPHKSYSADSFTSGRRVEETFSDFEKFTITSPRLSSGHKSTFLKKSDLTFPSDVQYNTSPCQSYLYVKSNLKPESSGPEVTGSGIQKWKKVHKIDTFKQESMLDVQMNANKILLSENAFPIILIAGGDDPNDNLKSRYILSYDCNKNHWQYAGYLPDYYSFHAAVFLKNKFYIIGGFQCENPNGDHHKITSKTICYDFARDMWLDKSNLLIPRACHAAVVVGNEIYVFGGRDQREQILASVEAYNELIDEWRECTPIPYPVYAAAVVSKGDIIYLHGGVTSEGENEHISYQTAFYDPCQNSWFTGPDRFPPLAFCGISTYLDSIWLFGGLTDDGKITSSKDIFTVTETGLKKQIELSIPRQSSVVVSLGSKVYIIGGHFMEVEEEVDTCEIIDLQQNKIYLASSLPVTASGKAGVLITNITTTKTSQIDSLQSNMDDCLKI